MMNGPWTDEGQVMDETYGLTKDGLMMDGPWTYE